MTYEQLLQVPANTPCLLADGSLGLLIRYWKDAAGIQVPGEEEIREVSFDRLVYEYETLREV